MRILVFLSIVKSFYIAPYPSNQDVDPKERLAHTNEFIFSTKTDGKVVDFDIKTMHNKKTDEVRTALYTGGGHFLGVNDNTINNIQLVPDDNDGPTIEASKSLNADEIDFDALGFTMKILDHKLGKINIKSDYTGLCLIRNSNKNLSLGNCDLIQAEFKIIEPEKSKNTSEPATKEAAKPSIPKKTSEQPTSKEVKRQEAPKKTNEPITKDVEPAAVGTPNGTGAGQPTYIILNGSSPIFDQNNNKIPAILNQHQQKGKSLNVKREHMDKPSNRKKQVRVSDDVGSDLNTEEEEEEEGDEEEILETPHVHPHKRPSSKKKIKGIRTRHRVSIPSTTPQIIQVPTPILTGINNQQLQQSVPNYGYYSIPTPLQQTGGNIVYPQVANPGTSLPTGELSLHDQNYNQILNQTTPDLAQSQPITGYGQLLSQAIQPTTQLLNPAIQQQAQPIQSIPGYQQLNPAIQPQQSTGQLQSTLGNPLPYQLYNQRGKVVVVPMQPSNQNNIEQSSNDKNAEDQKKKSILNETAWAMAHQFSNLFGKKNKTTPQAPTPALSNNLTEASNLGETNSLVNLINTLHELMD